MLRILDIFRNIVDSKVRILTIQKLSRNNQDTPFKTKCSVVDQHLAKLGLRAWVYSGVVRQHWPHGK